MSVSEAVQLPMQDARTAKVGSWLGLQIFGCSYVEGKHLDSIPKVPPKFSSPLLDCSTDSRRSRRRARATQVVPTYLGTYLSYLVSRWLAFRDIYPST